MRWSETVTDYYPVSPRPRYGHGQPSHPNLTRLFEGDVTKFAQVLLEIEACHETLHSIPHLPAGDNTDAPFWRNPWFSTLDAAALVGLMLARKPSRYVEIGSGFSTRFAHFAKKFGSLSTEILSIDPRPRAAIDTLCDRVIRQPLEACDLGLFEELGANDILFFDGSHRVFTNSDTTVFFIEVLPRLKPGVLIHIHDIFLPDDYPAAWNNRLYSEQYILAAMLLSGQSAFDVILPNYFVSRHPELGQRVKDLFASRAGQPAIPLTYPNDANCPGVSFWLTPRMLDARISPALHSDASTPARAVAAGKTIVSTPAAKPTPNLRAPGMQSLDFISRRMKDFEASRIFDVGANTGQSALEFAARFPKAEVYCFEPVPSTRDALRSTVEELPQIKVQDVALGRRSSVMRMQARDKHPMNRLLRSHEPLANSIEVQVTTGDEFCRSTGIDRLDFLKIDTEGNDLDVLLGFQGMLASQAISLVQVEAGMSPDNDRHVPLTRFLSLLGDYGYLLLHLFDEVRRNHRLPADQQQLHGMWFCNAVFVAEKPERLLLAPAGMNR